MIEGLSLSREYVEQPLEPLRIRPAERPGRVVFLAHSSYLSEFRIGSHQLARAFAHEGWEVLHVPTPVTPAHVLKAPVSIEYRRRLRRAWRGPEWIERHVRELIPFVWTPWQVARRFGADALQRYAWGAGAVHRRAAVMGFHRPDLLFIDEPRMAGLVPGFDPRVVIYRATDLYGHLKGDTSIIEAERHCLRLASGFVATSAPVWQHLCRLAPEARGRIVPNGVEFGHFSHPAPEPADMAELRWPRLVYVGALDDRFDWEVVRLIAQRRPGYQLVLIGPSPGNGQRRSARLPSNVHLIGPRPYERLPGYLQNAAVGLLPLSEHPANAGRSPMKLYEYGAAGLPVVATRTRELERRKLPFVKMFNQPEEAVAAVDAAVMDAEQLGKIAIEESRRMGWETRLGEILDFYQSLARSPARAMAGGVS